MAYEARRSCESRVKEGGWFEIVRRVTLDGIDFSGSRYMAREASMRSNMRNHSRMLKQDCIGVTLIVHRVRKIGTDSVMKHHDNVGSQ